ncbi:MAG: Decaprenylphosphoryl-beta-D-ribose oxidase [Acidimicrobiales bacterium]|nr:Decaprenylphosphoryl-beta-D-ribose oxidase [Acidimicrobiales bacterium]
MSGLPGQRHLLTGWGRTAPTAARVMRCSEPADVVSALRSRPTRGVLARGLGRSYGDAAQNAGGMVLETAPGHGLIDVDLEAGFATATAGTSLDQLMRWLVPLGWFVPVTPGTRYVTVGGAIAADVHGKNHHRTGSWCNHVTSFRLAGPDGGIREVDPVDDAAVFWATAGGMGLTGVIIDATFRLLPVESSLLSVDTDRAGDLDSIMELMESTDEVSDYSVAWIDLLATGASMGRSVLTRGRFAGRDELPDELAERRFEFAPRQVVTAPPLIPSGLLNRWTIGLFNEMWYRKSPQHRRGELQTISQFFHPLDMVGGWNRLYGSRGFLQWQCVVPFTAGETLRHAVERLSSSGTASFLAVLKRFGPGNQGPLSFPQEGWTLSLDIPVGAPELEQLLDGLDERVAEAGGRVYLAKDSRLRPELLSEMYPRLDAWREVRDELDPERRLSSDLGRRLGLC